MNHALVKDITVLGTIKSKIIAHDTAMATPVPALQEHVGLLHFRHHWYLPMVVVQMSTVVYFRG